MEAVLVLLLFGALGLLALPVVLLLTHGARLRALQSALERLTQRVATLELKNVAVPQPTAAAASKSATPPPLPSVSPRPVSVQPQAPPAGAVTPPPLNVPASAKAAKPAIDWEAFMGVKLFAWIGGFVLFLGVVFLVKYSFENNLITPVMRAVIGASIGLALVFAGWLTGRRNYRVPGQSLCATGVLVLYASIFGAHSFYELISLTTAFLFMSLITVGAFLLAVRLNAQVIVVLGLVGGFVTPLLLTKGENALGLFTYVALLNAGIAAVAIRKRWDYLLILAAVGSVAMQWLWMPLEAARAAAGFWIFLGLQAQFLAFAFVRQKLEPAERWSTRSAFTLACSSLAFGFWLLTFPSLARWPAFFFAFTFLADIGLLALAFNRRNPARIASAAGAITFALLASWTAGYLENRFLWWALGACLLFAVLHAGFSVWPARGETSTRQPARTWQGYVPLLALVLLFLCVWRGETSFAVWFCVLLVNGIAVALAWSTRSLAALFFALVATLVTAGLWIVTAPPVNESVVGILTVIGGFGVFFATASTFLSRKVGLSPNDSRRHVPAIAAAMPFVLLLMLVGKLPVPNPTLVFAVALLLAVLLLGLGIVARTSWIALVALVFTWAVEREWHTLHFSNTAALLALGWYTAFWLLFTAYPFFSAEEKTTVPWAVGALSGLPHFWLVFEVVSAAYPALRNGLLPAVFILPYALGVWHLIRRRGVVPASGDARLAWQGGAALLFLSLVFPVQFEREWITLGWAVEGLLLLLLFRRVPNAGLRLVGGALLTVAFIRLALNPAVFEYHPRASVRIWNWYLYAYGITSLCLFAGARAAKSPGDTAAGRVLPTFLYTLGTILTFLLLNIEIADYFSVGPTLTFSFSGNFARDMTYSIAWALFAFALLLLGMRQKTRWVRYAGVALLLFTLAKLFLHDFANLGPLYRIGAFIGVAIIMIVASFVYQRFLSPAAAKPSPAAGA